MGISGWTYAGWRGVFYPKTLPQHRELEYASRQLNSIEINGSFYHLPHPEHYLNWYESTPENFVFAVKANRYITHTLRLRGIERALSNFFATGILLLEDKLGPILWQFPPSMKFDAVLFEEFLNMLPKTTLEAEKIAEGHDPWMDERSAIYSEKKAKLKHAIEIRNPTFENKKFIELLRKFQVAIVIADAAAKWPFLEEATADFIYIRMHGAEELYASGYDDATLDHWARKMKIWKSGRQTSGSRFIAKKETSAPRDLYVYFDNDVKVRAPFDALALLQKLTDFEPQVPMPREPKMRGRRKAA